jgi:hypothetical protein
MTEFDIDIDETLTSMTRSAALDLDTGHCTIYVVACVGSEENPHVSHGGYTCDTGLEAILAAQEANAGEVTGCRYLPMAVGIHPPEVLRLARALMREGWGEDNT